MQRFSRLASTATRSYYLLTTHNQAIRRAFGRELTGRPVDTAAYTQRELGFRPVSRVGKPEETTNEHEPGTAKRETETTPGIEPKYTASAKPQRAAFSSLTHVGVNNPVEPVVQKRNNSTSELKDVSCAGLDGSPWPKEERDGRDQQIKEDRNSNLYYFEHHKPSPLSEIKFADTRKPITRETDGTVTEQDLMGVKDAAGWRPEQLDTAEESLERASRIFRENAMRGDPDSPHGRVLRALRGEWC